MKRPPRKSPAGRRGSKSNFRLGRQVERSAFALPASARFDPDGLVLPRTKDADAVAAAIIASGAVNRDSIFGRLNGWRLYKGEWYAQCGGKFHRMSKADMDAWLYHLLLKCVVVTRAGRLRPFSVRQASLRAVRCAMGRALTTCEDPMLALPAVAVTHG